MANKIAILGTGNGAYAIAADLSLKGCSINMYAPKDLFPRLEGIQRTKKITASGIINGEGKINIVTFQIEEAIKDVDIICFIMPAYRQEEYAYALAGKVRRSQVIVVFSGCFGSLAIAKILSQAGECPIIAETTSLPFIARRDGVQRVNVISKKKIGIGFFPSGVDQSVLRYLRNTLYAFEVLYNDVVECGLSLTNPVLHIGACIVNLSNIERPDVNFFLYEHGWSPSGMKINVALDRERKAIGKKLGYKIKPLEEFYNFSEDFNWQQFYAFGHGTYSLTKICGPNSINDRYLIEDIPFALVPWMCLGKIVDVDTPITTSVIKIMSIVHDKNWAQEGRSAEKLGIQQMDVKSLKKYICFTNI